MEEKSKRVFGTYTTNEKAKQELQKILKNLDKKAIYQLSEDKELGFIVY